MPDNSDATLETTPPAVDPFAEDDKDFDAREPALGASVWAEAEHRASELIRTATGKSLPDHLRAALSAGPGTQMLAIGASGGALALDLLRDAPEAALVCIDANAEWLRPWNERARGLKLNAQFVAVDLDSIELEPRAFDAIVCHAVLYRTVELERVADQIRRALRPGGSVIIVDVVTRNGHAMWGETREVVRPIWKTLPAKYRLNHTAYTVPLIDDVIWEPDPIPSGVKFARPEDVLPVIEERFSAEHFVPYFSLCRRFFDSMYGPNYDLGMPLDRAIFNWIWQLDMHYLAIGRLRPETFFGVYRAR
jgi:ubiquinone/menaquinone biosynthesis C-methylase UbiE